jgi:hypothetical protein
VGQQLPVDAWLHVFSFLPPRDLLTIGLVCSEWHSLSTHNHVNPPSTPSFKLPNLDKTRIREQQIKIIITKIDKCRVQVWRVVAEAMQPPAFYSHYAAHLLAYAQSGAKSTVDDGGPEAEEEAEEEASSFKRAFMTRCERDLRWERKEYSTQHIHISFGERASCVRGVAISPTVSSSSFLFFPAIIDVGRTRTPEQGRIFRGGVRCNCSRVQGRVRTHTTGSHSLLLAHAH